MFQNDRCSSLDCVSLMLISLAQRLVVKGQSCMAPVPKVSLSTQDCCNSCKRCLYGSNHQFPTLAHQVAASLSQPQLLSCRLECVSGVLEVLSTSHLELSASDAACH